MEDTGFDGWADLGAQRRAEDEVLLQRYAVGEGRGQDLRPIRGFVREVRGRIGPSGVICQVRMTEEGGSREIIVWFYFPQNGRPGRPQTATVRDAARPADVPDDLPALSRTSAAAPPSLTRPRPTQRPGETATGGASASSPA